MPFVPPVDEAGGAGVVGAAGVVGFEFEPEDGPRDDDFGAVGVGATTTGG